MKHLLRSAFLAGLMLCAGCFTTAPPKITEPTPIAEPKAPPPVTADKINAQNVHQKAQEFSDELDFELSRNALRASH